MFIMPFIRHSRSYVKSRKFLGIRAFGSRWPQWTGSHCSRPHEDDDFVSAIVGRANGTSLLGTGRTIGGRATPRPGFYIQTYRVQDLPSTG